jgi:hypothetical protein
VATLAAGQMKPVRIFALQGVHGAQNCNDLGARGLLLIRVDLGGQVFGGSIAPWVRVLILKDVDDRSLDAS